MTTLDSTISVPEGVLFRDLAGEAVLLSLKTGVYYGLNEVGTRMWLLLTEHRRVEPAHGLLVEEYDVPEDLLRQDLLGLVDELASFGLLSVDEA